MINKFRKYNSIENSYREKTVNKIKELGYATPNNAWYVTEKIHGANFQVATDGIDVWFSSRNGVLEDDDNFYGYFSIKERLEESIKTLWEYYGTVMKTIEGDSYNTIVRVYGELFGGSYNHPDVDDSKHATIQKGVFYTPDIEFIAFDMFFESQNDSGYVSFPIAGGFLEHVGILPAEVLFFGTLDACLEYQNDYESTIPKRFGLPKIQDNICEGNVIRPVVNRWFPHSDPSQASRVILKNKNKKFSEKNVHKKEKVDVVLSDAGEEALKEALTYVNDNRYNNVISKIGEIDYADTSNIGKILGLMIKDTMQDFYKDFEMDDEISKSERGKIQKAVTGEIRNLVLSKF